MSEATADESVEEDISESEETASTPMWLRILGEKKRQLIIAGLTALLVVGAGAGAYFGGLFDLFGEFVGTPGGQTEVMYYDLPEMVVNLESGTKKKSFLKIQLSLELDEDVDTAVLDHILPRVIDQFHVYLRELRADDLRGSAGIYRLKEELLRRISAAAHPIHVRDVLFKEMLIQ